jgi:hypothetical protein
MGFADGLRELLGGFNAVRRIDQDGFDWREKDKAAQFARDRAMQVAGQQDEDRAVGQVTDALSAQDFDQEPDLAAVQPLLQGIAQERQKAFLATALGRRKQQKDYLEMLRGNNASTLQGLKGEQATELQGLRGEQAQELARLKAKLATERTLSPAEQARMDMLERQAAARAAQFDRAEAGRNSRFERGGSVRFALNPDGTYGMGYSSRLSPSGEPQTFEVPEALRGLRQTVPATQIEAGNVGVAQEGGLETIKALFNPDWVGPIAGGIGYEALTKIPGVPAPDDKRVRLTTATAGLRNDVIKARTGAQMSEAEVPRLSEEIPLMTDKPEVFQAKLQLTDARVQVLNAVRDGRLSKQEAIRIINQSTLDGAAPQIPPRRASGLRGRGRRRRSPPPTPQGGGQHGPPVKRKRMPDGSTMFRDAQGNTWQE